MASYIPPHNPTRPGTADPSTRFQRVPHRSQTAPVRPPPSSSAHVPDRIHRPILHVRQVELAHPVVELRINHNHDVLVKALDAVSKTAHKESERIRYDLHRLATIVESGATSLTNSINTLESALRKEEARVARDFHYIRQIQDPRKRGPELDCLEATLQESEKQMAYEYTRLQTVRNSELERAESTASSLIQAKRNEEARLARDLQRLHDARAEARRRVDDELASLAHRGLTEWTCPCFILGTFAAFTTQRSKSTTEFNLEARRVTDMRREKKRAIDAEMLRLTKVRNDCRLRIDAEISRFMTAERFTRASQPQSKPQRTHQQKSQAQQAREAWQRYEDTWTELSNSDAPVRLNFHNIPWPAFSQPTGVAQLNSRSIGAFLLSSLHDGGGSTRRERIRNAMRLWHPDKWMGRYMGRVDPRHAQSVKDGVNAVARALTELLATA
ncbi:hypothetical protein RHS01_05233 [Rhizoctonia solani]|uniref:Uncharacterized protein n=1 Tax=Rhizoctonia solani TaxID=456999 RepID=A0A8H7IE89_9AGAM|nr:hypothetical protein RHS01_05233 [Rhizoctonia solani]